MRLVLVWIARRLAEGERVQAPLRFSTENGGSFGSDARPEDGRCWVGGQGLPAAGGTKAARWFALEVEREWFPWAWAKKDDPKRVIAALELLGTLLCV